jgi:uncharacterized membrane protein YphA (DoxX/SURF4 family)
MKKDKIIYWVTTIFIFLFEGVMPAFTFTTPVAREGISHLGYPMYFGTTLVVFKVLGSLILVIPGIKGRLKELAYAGFIFDFLFACISHWHIDGFGGQTIFPLIILAILMVSYVYYHKLNNSKTNWI